MTTKDISSLIILVTTIISITILSVLNCISEASSVGIILTIVGYITGRTINVKKGEN